MALGISKKLFVLFSLFSLIFYGTVFDMFVRVKSMSQASNRIVGVDNKIASLSKGLRDSLIDMEVNDKKFRLLKKKSYYELFDTARLTYTRNLEAILNLSAGSSGNGRIWQDIHETYKPYTQGRSMEAYSLMPKDFGKDEFMTQWMDEISRARKAVAQGTELALIQISEQSRKIVRNGVIGFGISILVGILGILFISRSVIIPLGKLKSGLTQISKDNYSHTISIDTDDEFSELAKTFNQMSRQLQEDEEIRSDFIACLSHEIRTPLSSIKESVNMITEEVLGPVNPKQKKFLNIAGSEITRITSLLNHLLETSMPALKKVDPLPLEPSHLVEEALQSLEAKARGKDIQLSYLPRPDLPRVLGEKKEILQVLLNIIGNALKFSPVKGRVDVRVSQDPKAESVIFSISDTGPGIPGDKHGLIFKKYYRAREVREHMDGVGLGLNIARKIVLAHGGNIFVTNNSGRGCTFSFTLPVYKIKRLKRSRV